MRSGHRQASELSCEEKLFMNHVHEKGLASRVYKELSKLSITKWANTNKHMKRCSTSLAVTEHKVKQSETAAHSSTRTAKTRHAGHTQGEQGFRGAGSPIHYRQECKPAQPPWKTARHLKTKNLEKEMATHSSILAQRIPWAQEPG